ncbi:MAG: hypothetical protein WDN49_05995 [Acetobacteraceae bacterium]
MLQIPAGIVLDRLGVTLVGRAGAFLWAVASGLTAVAGGFTGISRPAAAGRGRGADLSANAKATGYWFPRGERALATAIFDAAAKFSNVIGVPIVALAITAVRLAVGFRHHGHSQPDLLCRLLGALSRSERGQAPERGGSALTSRRGRHAEGQAVGSTGGMLATCWGGVRYGD